MSEEFNKIKSYILDPVRFDKIVRAAIKMNISAHGTEINLSWIQSLVKRLRVIIRESFKYF